MDQSILRWFGHVERMENDVLARRMYESEMQGHRCRERPYKRWMDGVKKVLYKRGLNNQEAKECVQVR